MSNRNATASWSGYSHQGMVGFLVALREIQRLIGIGNQNDFSDYFLIYESFEDFALYKLVNGTKEFLSVHQVKAYYSDGHLFNSYSEVFTGKRIYQKAANGKHVKNAAGQKTPTGSFEAGQWCQAANYLHTAMAINNWPADFVAVGGNPHSIQRFNYEIAKLHCGTNEISPLIIAELMSPAFHDGNQGNATIALQRFCFDLDEKIRNEHATKNGKTTYEIQFSFQALFNRVMSNVDISESEVFKSRKLFYETYNEIIRTEDISEDRIDEIYMGIIKPINVLTNENFLLFLQRLNLNETAENLKLPQVYYNSPGLKQVFFRMLIDVEHTPPSLDENSVQFKTTSNNYVLTAIIDEERDKLTVVKNIIDNLTSQNLLWENHSLVNKDIETDLITSNPAINLVATSEEKEDDKGKFMSFTNSKLVKRDSAKNILNNGGAA